MYIDISSWDLSDEDIEWLEDYFGYRVEFINPREELLDIRGIIDYNLSEEALRIYDATTEEKVILSLK